jgi:[ribosomal protein S18]-alanine N-acetyltransferase
VSEDPGTRHVSILWAEPEHAELLAGLHAKLFAEAWNAESLRELLGHPGSTAFYARFAQDPEPVAFIVARLAADEMEVLTIGVRPDRQGRGIGKQLLQALLRAAVKAGARRLFLEVAEDNLAALAIYKGAGFQQVGTRAAYYSGRHDGHGARNALVLARTV